MARPYIFYQTVQTNEQFLNDGKGNFSLDTRGQVGIRFGHCNFATVGDLDGNGLLDLYVGSKEQDIIGFNVGNAYFDADYQAKTGLGTAYESTAVARPVDIDGDGTLDVLIRGNRFFLGDGCGNFRLDLTNRLQGMTFPPVAQRVQTLCDVDGDKDPDLLTEDDRDHLSLLLNDGKGFFTPSAPADFVCNTLLSHAQFADLDNDGDTDLITSTSSMRNQVYINVGKGRLVDWYAGGDFTKSLNRSGELHAVDLDRDGDIDVLAYGGGNDGFLKIFCNQARQVFARSAPVVGHNYSLEFQGKPGYAKGPILVVPAMSLGKLWTTIPGLGQLGLNPSTMLTLPDIVIGASGGIHKMLLPVPKVNSLLHMSIFFQAVFHEAGQQGAFFSNVHQEVIR